MYRIARILRIFDVNLKAALRLYKIPFKFLIRDMHILGREGAPIARSHFSQDAASAAPHCSARPQAHLASDDALSGAGYAWAKFKLRLTA
ncbi:MAG: hypothetical protein KH703_04715 [Campylobacter gracilis]|uniref:hypothetical protein n=1 Tax=Campylobacter gracilis TaxID=824 RepID=UPI0026ECE223|nr:hypothetical protein [Campylobacter gracilis]MBS6152702.1 hypothetical protein [Campylobacter gracilis]